LSKEFDFFKKMFRIQLTMAITCFITSQVLLQYGFCRRKKTSESRYFFEIQKKTWFHTFLNTVKKIK